MTETRPASPGTTTVSTPLTEDLHEPLGVGIGSEVGILREVMVHRPGVELDRLTPDNAADLLFDDVMWAERAREEHDEFSRVLEAHGVRVHHFGDLLTEALDEPAGREFAVSRICTDERFGPPLARDLRSLFANADASVLAEYLIGGVLKRDLAPLSTRSVTWSQLDIDDFVLAPLPNTLFQRDNTAWIGSSATVNPMARPARARESLNTRTVYRHHPRFATADFDIIYGDDEVSHAPATLEGGDIHVIADGVVMIGMGERTTAMGVEVIATRLFEAGRAHTVLAVELPRARSAMHLDTVLTMVDVATFVAYPYFDLVGVRMWKLSPAEGGSTLEVDRRDDVQDALEEVLGREVVIHRATEDRREAQREQWNDADNFLAIAPGVVIGYERNTTTNRMLQAHGVEVLTVAGSELGRGRGGARCMSAPIHRESL